jgi:glutathione S-transferase
MTATAMTRPVLYVFAISHYCEKARWALDYFNIDHRIEILAPGPHIKFSRALGAASTTLPLLVAGELVVQGSAQIVDWAQARGQSPGRRLEASADTAACRKIEKRLDAIFGVHVRRYYYSDALFSEPHKVKPMFTRDLPWRQRLVVNFAWGKICKAMIRGLDLGATQGIESRQLVETELDWLDDLLAGGRAQLVGDRFSRADLAAASLLSTLALPQQHPTYNDLQIPAGVAADLKAWRERPVLQWTRDIYQRYRSRDSGSDK